MKNTIAKIWSSVLTDEDYTFIKGYLMADGNLADLAAMLDVPLQQLEFNLDELRRKINHIDENITDQFCAYLLELESRKVISCEIYKSLVSEYMRVAGQRK